MYEVVYSCCTIMTASQEFFYGLGIVFTALLCLVGVLTITILAAKSLA